MVYAQRRTREGETLPKRIVASLGYRLIKRIAEVDIPPNTGDFRLMSRRVVDHVVALDESHGFLRGLVGLVGFPQTSVLYDRDARAAGNSKYNRFLGSLVIGLNGVVGFSRYPLALHLDWRDLSQRFAFLLAIIYLVLKIARHRLPDRQPDDRDPALSVQRHPAAFAGVMGEYVGRIYDEVRRRPKYIIESHPRLGSRPGLTPPPVVHPRRRARDPARRADPRHPQAADRGRGRAVPRPSAAAAGGIRHRFGHARSRLPRRADRGADRLERFGIRIAYSYDSPGLTGTLGAVRRAPGLLGERFLVLYGDTYLRIDYAAAACAWEESGLPALMTVLRNVGRWDTSNAIFDGALVTAYDKAAPSREMHWIDYGLGGLTADVIDAVGPRESDLAALYRGLARHGSSADLRPPAAFTRLGPRAPWPRRTPFCGPLDRGRRP